MANEAVCIVAPKTIITRNCYDAVAIAKGTVLKLSGTNYVYPSVAADTGVAFGGIAVEEKTASDGIVTIGVACCEGVYDLVNSSPETPAVGKPVCLSGANTIRAAIAADLLTGSVIGKLEEVGVASTALRVRLGL